MAQAVTSFDARLQPEGERLLASAPGEKLDAKVQGASQKLFDEFSAPDPLVTTILTAEAAGVVRNGLAIPLEVVSTTSQAAVGLGLAAAPCYIIAGVVMTVVGAMLFPKCCADFKSAMQNDSTEEKWRSSLNLLDKTLLFSLGAVLCVIGACTFAVLLSTKAAVVALAAAVITVASVVFAAMLAVRGAEMMARGGYGLWKANQFQNQFQEHCVKGDAAKWLQGEKERDAAALKNRIGQKAFDELAAGGSENLLKVVDEGICEEKLKQQLFLSIGAVMFVGGTLSLVALALSNGMAAPAVVAALGIVGSSFSLSMEALWMPYDNPKWFKKLSNWSYSKHVQSHPLPKRV